MKSLLVATAFVALMGVSIAPVSAQSGIVTLPGTIEEEIENLERSIKVLENRIKRENIRSQEVSIEIEKLNLTLENAQTTANELERYRRICLTREQRFDASPTAANRRSYASCVSRYEGLLTVMEVHIGSVDQLQVAIERLGVESTEIAQVVSDLREDLNIEKDVLGGLTSTR